jgi:chaperonin cofactor prefoldin
MERTVWSDERLDDRFESIDRRFDRLDSDLRDVRTELRDLRTLMFQLWGTNMVAILITLVAVVVRT